MIRRVLPQAAGLAERDKAGVVVHLIGDPGSAFARPTPTRIGVDVSHDQLLGSSTLTGIVNVKA
jgi:hypothetical protein